MDPWTITKWELKNTFKSRKFILIFTFQILVLLLVLFMFIGFIEMISSGEISATPSVKGFAELNVNDPTGAISKNLNPEVLILKNSSSKVHGGHSLLVVENPNKLPIKGTLYVDYSDPKRSVIRDEVKVAVEKSSAELTDKLLASIQKSPEKPEIREFGVGEPLPYNLVNRLMISILLFLPLFLCGNMVIDSIVGEKERKTAEVLLAIPFKRSNIILGKALAVILIISLQVLIWMTIIILSGFEIKNPLIVYLIIILTVIPVVGLTCLVSVFSMNYREAGIGITFMYIIVAGYLIVPALLNIAGGEGDISPMTLLMKLLAGENLKIADILSPISLLIIFSFIFYGASILLFERDDIIFGPRPPISKILRGGS